MLGAQLFALDGIGVWCILLQYDFQWIVPDRRAPGLLGPIPFTLHIAWPVRVSQEKSPLKSTFCLFYILEGVLNIIFEPSMLFLFKG